MKLDKWPLCLVILVHLLILLAFYQGIGHSQMNQSIQSSLSASMASMPKPKIIVVKPHTDAKSSGIVVESKSSSTASQTLQVHTIELTSKDKQMLLKLLTDAIADQLAREDTMNASGKLALQFVLQPNGGLENIIITHSSGQEDLDQIAITAVEAISPIQLPGTMHLTAPIQLSLPIKFER